MGRVIDSRTRTKILQAALHHIALFGEEKLSMSGVADEASLSRGTVYRYFTNREQLLDALAEFVRERFQSGVTRAIEGGGDTRDKLRRIFAGSIDQETRLAVQRLRELQPAFTLTFLTTHMPDFNAVFKAALRDDFEGRDLRLGIDEFVELLTRMSVGTTLFGDSPELVERLMLTLWDAIQPAENRNGRTAAIKAVKPARPIKAVTTARSA
jgi:AcrR family transcriptional regulator